jgi:hypothetical protein
MRHLIKDFLAVSAVLVLLCGRSWPAQAQDQPELQILVIGGEGSINNPKQRIAREPVVEVRDRNNRPVAGAVVLFEAPRSGASGTFVGGSPALRVTTNELGRAVGQGFQANSTSGNFTMQVTATYQNATATATIHMSNAAAGAIPNAAHAGILHGKLIAIVVAAGAAAAAGTAVAVTRGGSSTPSTTPPPPTTISLGTGSVGPHP